MDFLIQLLGTILTYLIILNDFRHLENSKTNEKK